MGGLLASDIAVESQAKFDRVLLMNPYFGPHETWMYLVGVFPHVRFSWDLVAKKTRGCESARAMSTTAGYCQAYLGNLYTMMLLSTHLFCRKWGIQRCMMAMWHENSQMMERSRKALSELPSLQLLGTTEDTAVQNYRVFQYLDAVTKWRRKASRETHSCFWPVEVTHNYLVPPEPGTSHNRSAWTVEYIEAKVLGYLLRGEPVEPAVRRGPASELPSRREDLCLPPSNESVVGTRLTILPVIQNPQGYDLAVPDSAEVIRAKSLWNGTVASAGAGRLRHAAAQYADKELVQVADSVLLVSRLSVDGAIRGMHVVHQDVRGGDASLREGDCLTLAMTPVDPLRPLVPQLPQASEQLRRSEMTDHAKLCGGITPAYCRARHCKDSLATVRDRYRFLMPNMRLEHFDTIFHGDVRASAAGARGGPPRESQQRLQVLAGRSGMLVARRLEDQVEETYFVSRARAQSRCLEVSLISVARIKFFSGRAPPPQGDTKVLEYCSDDLSTAVCKRIQCH